MTHRRGRVPLTEAERQQWIYEDMLEAVRQGGTYDPGDAPEVLPDFSSPSYISPDAMVGAETPDGVDFYPQPAHRDDSGGEDDQPTWYLGFDDDHALGDDAAYLYLDAEDDPLEADEDDYLCASEDPFYYDAGYAPPGPRDRELLAEALRLGHPDQDGPPAPTTEPGLAAVAPAPTSPAVAPVTAAPPPVRRSRKQENRAKKPALWRRLVRLWPLLIVLAVLAALVTTVVAVWEHYTLRHPAGVTTSVEISRDTDAAPVVSLEAPLALTFPKTEVVTAGTGEPLAEGDPVLLRLTVFDGQTGELLSSGDAPHYLAGRVDAETLTPDLKAAVLAQRVGSRLALRRPVSRSGQQMMEIDVIDVLPTSPTGQPTDPDPGAPVQLVPDSAVPEIASMVDEPPAAAYLKVIRAGEGAQVRDGQSMIANFVVWRWHDKQQTSNTWAGRGPQVIDLAGAMTGLREQLSDQRVGSRVLMVLPPEQAKGDDTLIVVADILAVSEKTS